MIERHRRPWLALALLASLACPPPAAAGQFKLLTGLDYSAGRYGGSDDTEVWALPLTVKYQQGPVVWKLSVPYVRMTAPTGTTNSGGDITAGGGQRVTRSGWGDLVAGVAWSVWEQPRHGLLLDLGTKIKLGTGSTDKGLSNGEDDYSLFADFYVPWGRWTPFATLGRRWPGSPPGLDADPAWYGTLGLNWKAAAQDNLGLMLDGRQPTYPHSPPRREMTGYWSHKLTPAWKLQTYAVAGSSDASPDWGLGVMVIHSP